MMGLAARDAGGSVRTMKRKTAAHRAAVILNQFGTRTRLDARRFLHAGVGAQRVSLVGALPRELRLRAAEVSERRGLAEDRPAQVEAFDDGLRRQLEVG